MLANSGECADCNYGDSADRIAFISPLLGHIFAVAYDIDQIGPFQTQQPGETVLNLAPAANVNTLTFAALRWRDDRARARRRAAGKTTVEYGAYVSYRWQNTTSPPRTCPPRSPSRSRAHRSCRAATRRRRSTAGRASRTHGSARGRVGRDVRADPAGVGWSPAVLYRVPVTAQQMGAALESEIGPVDSRFSAGLDAGYASGDPSPGFGGQLAGQARRSRNRGTSTARRPTRRTTRPSTTSSSAPTTSSTASCSARSSAPSRGPSTPGRTRAWTSCAWRPGCCRRASPASRRRPSTPRTRRAVRAPSASRSIPTLAYASRDGFGIALEYAVLFPLAGLDNPVAHLNASPAQLGRVRVMYRF